MAKEAQIHGSLFLLLQSFIKKVYGNAGWQKIMAAAGNKRKMFDMHENYPLAEMQTILVAGTKLTGLSEADLLEQFGQQIVPDLLAMYKKYINPEWKTFELLEYTELVMHKAVRKEEHKAHPPVLNISRVHDKLLIIDYYSQRKMGSLAVGIIKGIAKYYNEQDIVHVMPLTNPNDERVQIRVEFD